MTHIAGMYEVAINGQPYRVAQGDYTRRFLDVIRQQADNSGEPSEFSLNPNDLWRRAQSEWVYGQGQLYLDDADGERRRFYTGSGVEAFCGCKKIHPHTAAARVDTNAGALDYTDAVVTGDAIYVSSVGGETLEKFAAAQSTTSAPDTGNAILSVVTVGDVLYASTVNGIWAYDEGADTWTKVVSGAPTLMEYVKGRLMAVVGSDVYNITDVTPVTALPTSLTADFIDPDVEWTAIGEADGFILLAGLSGQSSLIYRATILPEGTTLTSPVQMVQLPSGERVHAIKTYLGVTALATSAGVRIGRFSGSDFIYGPLVYEGEVRDLEPKGKFFYFAMAGGVGKLDLSTFLPDEDLAPAHISSYRGDATLQTLAVVSRPPAVTIGDNSDYELMFVQDTNGATDEGGLFEAQSTYDTGVCEFETGRVTYGMADVKRFMFLNVVGEMSDPDDQIIVSSITEDGSESVVGEINATNESATFFLNESGEHISFKFKFINGDSTYTTKPELLRWTLRSLPVPRRTEQIIVPLDLRASQTTHSGGVDYQDVWDQFAALQTLVRSGEAVTYQEFDRAFLATLENVQLGPDLDVDKDFSDWEGVAAVTLRIYDSTVIASGAGLPDAGDNMFGMTTYGTPMFGE